jgi:hypothetical protein
LSTCRLSYRVSVAYYPFPEIRIKEKNKKIIKIICKDAKKNRRVRVRVVVFNATYMYISVILWWSILLVEETGVPRENHRPVTSH